MTIREILDRVSEYHPDMGEDYHGCDEVKFGDCSQECTGTVSALVPTVDVIRRTIELKANLLYVHEPVSYLTPDWPEWKADYKCRIYDEKLKLLKENKIVLVRDHDHMHAHKPDSIFTGVMKYLGWIELAFWAFSFLTGSFAIKVSLVLGLAGFLAFYGREVFDWCVDTVKDWKRRRDWENRNR